MILSRQSVRRLALLAPALLLTACTTAPPVEVAEAGGGETYSLTYTYAPLDNENAARISLMEKALAVCDRNYEILSDRRIIGSRTWQIRCTD